jgi:hypothetical protein
LQGPDVNLLLAVQDPQVGVSDDGDYKLVGVPGPSLTRGPATWMRPLA